MKLVTLILSLGSLALSATALASDSTHQVCTGFGAISVPNDSMKKLQRITLKYDEGRAGAATRKTDIQMSFNGRRYTGNAVTEGDLKLAIKAVNISDTSDVAFDGTLELLQGSGLEIKGKIRAEDGSLVVVSGALECIDI